MNGFNKNKKPDQNTIDFIEFFMRVSDNMFGTPVAMPTHHDLISSTAVKMAKDIGGLEDLDSQIEINNEVQYFKGLLINWVANGWIKDQSKIDIGDYFNNPDNACPNCGWKNSTSKRVTACFNCQTGMISVDGKWCKVNDYIDPEGFYIPTLKNFKTRKINKIENKQKEFFGNLENINVPLGYHDIVQDWKKLSLQYHYRKQWDSGLLCIIEAINIDPYDSPLWRDLHNFGMESGFIELSYNAAKFLLSFRPEDYIKFNFNQIFKDKKKKLILFQRGMTHCNRQEFEKGFSCFRTGLKMDQTKDYNIDLNFGMGWAYFHMKEFNRALPYFEKVLESKDSSFIPHIENSCNYKIGLIHIVNNRFKESLPYLEKALSADPTDEVIKNWINVAQLGIKDPIKHRVITSVGNIKEPDRKVKNDSFDFGFSFITNREIISHFNKIRLKNKNKYDLISELSDWINEKAQKQGKNIIYPEIYQKTEKFVQNFIN
jgi:tetratricopeptide (TPR) repeat protein